MIKHVTHHIIVLECVDLLYMIDCQDQLLSSARIDRYRLYLSLNTSPLLLDYSGSLIDLRGIESLKNVACTAKRVIKRIAKGGIQVDYLVIKRKRGGGALFIEGGEKHGESHDRRRRESFGYQSGATHVSTTRSPCPALTLLKQLHQSKPPPLTTFLSLTSTCCCLTGIPTSSMSLQHSQALW